MAGSNSFSTLITWGAIGLGAWWLYENFFGTTAATAAASTTPTQPAQPTQTNTVAASGGAPLMNPITQAQPVAIQQTTPTTPTRGTTTTAAQFMGLASLFSKLQSVIAASGDPAITMPSGRATYTAVPDVFNYYLEQIIPNAPASSPAGWPPDVLQVFPGVDRTQPMSLTTYWQGMSGYLASKLGLSGLGIFAGLGMIADASRRWPEMPNGQWGRGMWWGAGRAVQ